MNFFYSLKRPSGVRVILLQQNCSHKPKCLDCEADFSHDEATFLNVLPSVFLKVVKKPSHTPWHALKRLNYKINVIALCSVSSGIRSKLIRLANVILLKYRCDLCYDLINCIYRHITSSEYRSDQCQLADVIALYPCSESIGLEIRFSVSPDKRPFSANSLPAPTISFK